MPDISETQPWDAIWIGGQAATMEETGSYGIVEAVAIGVQGGLIEWIGSQADLPASPDRCARLVHDLDGAWVTPGLIDCHTHLAFGGERANEFERRLEGATYEEIAREGGGILSTVRATRMATEEELLVSATSRLEELLAEGVTTVEIKSGYGLETQTELRQLRVGRRLGERGDVDVVTTLLAAHALPPEYRGRRDVYLDLVCKEILPEAVGQGLADAVDAFCEGIAFGPAECRRVFESGRALGLRPRIHADQLSDTDGARLAADVGALSADHLEYASRTGVEAMAAAGTVAVLLPGAFYFLGESQLPPVGAMRELGVDMAVATDCNPGTSPLTSILTAMNLACTQFGLSPVEALAGVTRVAARALGLDADRGTLERGKRADFALWTVGHPRELAYWIGRRPLRGVVKGGVAVSLRDDG